MNEHPYTPPNSDLENRMQNHFHSAPLDPTFIPRLEGKLIAHLDPDTPARRAPWRLPAWLQPTLRSLAWSGGVVLLAVALIWGINHLGVLPGGVPLAAVIEETPTVQPADAGYDLVNTRWGLVTLNGADLITNTSIDLLFEANRVSGFAGCNHYQWALTPEGPIFPPVDLSVTVEGCVEPQGVFEQEQAYLDALSQASQVQATPNRLELLDAAGQALLVFLPAEQMTPTTEPVAEPTTEVIAELEPTVDPQPPLPTEAGIETLPTPTVDPLAGEFALYLLEGDPKVGDVFDGSVNLEELTPQAEPVLANADIIAYDPVNHVLQIDAAAQARLEALEVPISGTPFIACVGTERIFAGAFWNLLSSQYFVEGVVINIEPGLLNSDRLQLNLGYPSDPDELPSEAEDPRVDPRILDALRAAGKLSSTLLDPGFSIPDTTADPNADITNRNSPADPYPTPTPLPK